MIFTEKNLEDLICNDPKAFIGEGGIVNIKRQFFLDGFRADILCSDSMGSHLLIEIQRGSLDRTHIWKILDYGYRLKKQSDSKSIRLMVIANHITKKQIETLDHLGVEYREIPESEFFCSLPAHDLSDEIKADHNEMKLGEEPEPLDPIYDRGLDARYFGFSGTRAIAAALYARNQGATQNEVNDFVREITPQKGFYNLLDQAQNKWRHEVVIWNDQHRGRVFKLIYNPAHKGPRNASPPPDWIQKNCVPPGTETIPYVRKTRKR